MIFMFVFIPSIVSAGAIIDVRPVSLELASPTGQASYLARVVSGESGYKNGSLLAVLPNNLDVAVRQVHSIASSYMAGQDGDTFHRFEAPGQDPREYRNHELVVDRNGRKISFEKRQTSPVRGAPGQPHEFTPGTKVVVDLPEDGGPAAIVSGKAIDSSGEPRWLTMREIEGFLDEGAAGWRTYFDRAVRRQTEDYKKNLEPQPSGGF